MSNLRPIADPAAFERTLAGFVPLNTAEQLIARLHVAAAKIGALHDIAASRTLSEIEDARYDAAQDEIDTCEAWLRALLLERTGVSFDALRGVLA